MEANAWKRYLGPVCAAIGLHLVLLSAFLAAPKSHGDPSALVCLPDDKVGRHPFEHVHVGFGPNGYDGQYSYALAQIPGGRIRPKPSPRRAIAIFACCIRRSVGRSPAGILSRFFG